MRRLITLALITLPVFAEEQQPSNLEALPEVPSPPLPVQSGEN